MQVDQKVFAFGENWLSFISNCFDDSVIEEAMNSLRNFCGEENIRDKTFIDIGCGSGLFSLAAYKLGAKSITSIDVDKYSVQCSEQLKVSYGNPENWKVMHGSALDDNFLATLGQFDFVYSWGVLHHTGSMWKAIDNVSKLVKPNGHFCIAIYNKSDGLNIYPDFRFGNSYLWYLEKKFYCSLPGFLQTLVDYVAMSGLIFFYLITFTNPFKQIKSHKKFRGMDWKTDIKDWLGGYPYEYATVEEIFKFFKERKFTLENLISNNGLLNNEFLFKK